MRQSLLLSLLACSVASAGPWPQWRGPKNDGVSPETGIPAEWGPDKNVVRKIPLPGVGSSTPAIWGDNIFLTAQEGKDALLLCLGTDGKEKWRRKMGSGEVYTRGDEGGNLATPSPTTDGKHVWAFDGSGMLVCYDVDGNLVWGYDTEEKYGKFAHRQYIQFGAHWTPVLHKGRLYVCLQHRAAQLAIALDAATGKELWKVNRASDAPKGVESPDVYSSPFVWEKGDRALLIVHGNDYCTAHSLEDGSEVWRVTELNPKANYNRTWRAVSSPLVTPDLIVVPSCKSHPTAAVKPAEAKGAIAPGHPAEAWRYKATPDVPSPLLVGDVVYLMGATGQLYALDARTGKEVYPPQRLTNERHRANPLSVDGKVIMVGREGTMVVLKPGTTFEELAKNTLPDTFTASPAAADGKLYLRGWKFLWVIGQKQ